MYTVVCDILAGSPVSRRPASSARAVSSEASTERTTSAVLFLCTNNK